MSCYGTSRTLCDIKDCEKCFPRSFASHEKAEFWSSQNEKTAREVLKGNSSKEFLFDCNNCNHTFSAILSNITKGRWCPYCSIPSKKLCDDKDCDHCFNKSFASHEKAEFWDKKNDFKPRDVLKGSGKEYRFKCGDCKHVFEKALNKTSTRWCPYCSSPPQKLCDKKKCTHCFNNSFASHEKAKYWHIANTETPRMVFKNAKKKYLFLCENKHTFEKSPNAINWVEKFCDQC